MSFSPILTADADSINEAVGVLREGGVIAYPTETLYGLGGLAAREEVVRRVLAIKNRGPEKPLPLIVADEEAAQENAEMNALAEELARLFWPGPLTMILKARRPFPQGAALAGKIALRVSSHPVAQTLARRLDEAILATSANPTGQPGTILASEVRDSLSTNPPDLILAQDPCPGGAGSTIVDLTVAPPRIVRAGAIPASELEEFIKGWA